MPGEAPQNEPQLSQHEAAMAAKFDQVAADAAAAAAPSQPAQDPAKPQVATRPDNVPEKFWDATKGQVNTEALLQSYTELESKGAKPVAEGTPTVDQAAAATQQVGAESMAKFSAEFAEKGQLSQETYQALADKGISKDIVDGYIAGQVAIANARDQAGYTVAGGREAYGQMIQWAGSNLSPADQAAFNQAVVGSAAQMKQAVLALKAQYDSANGQDPKLVHGQNDGSSDGDKPFESRAQVTEAMRDPRYRKDPAYRSMVERRIGLMDDF